MSTSRQLPRERTGEARLGSWRSSLLPAAPLIGLIVVVTAAVVLLLVIDSKLTFYQDTWAFLLDRRSFSVASILHPHNEHIVVIPVLLQQLLLVLFGMSSAMPEYVLLTLMLAATAVLLFVYASRRVGPWIALVMASLLLFLGPAWETTLWPFEICFVGSVLFGLAMLLALERRDARGDLLACVFLLISIGFNTLGLAFVVAAAVEVFLSRKSRGWRRAYLFLVPALLWLAWYAAWGHAAGNGASLDNLLGSPRYVLDSLAATLESLVGLVPSPLEGSSTLAWGRPLVFVLLAAVAIGQWRRPGFSRALWPPLAALLTYWFLTALNHDAAREPITSRYLYAGGALALICAANLLAGVRIGPRVRAVIGICVVAAIASNLLVLKGGGETLRSQAVLTRSVLGAMEVARGTIDPQFVPSGEAAGTGALINVEAGKYFEAVDELGSPAYDPAELAAASSLGSEHADFILAQAEGLVTEPLAGRYRASPRSSGCTTVEPGAADGAPGVPLAPGANLIEVAPGPRASLSLGRFSQGQFPVPTAGAAGDSVTRLRIPQDHASGEWPWQLKAKASQPVRVCTE